MMRKYYKRKDIMTMFSCGESVYQKAVRFIREHPDRYSYYGCLGNLVNPAAFADAVRWCKTPDKDVVCLPPFEPQKALMMMDWEVTA